MVERKVITLKRALYINIPADVAAKLDIKANDNLVVTVRNGSVVYSKLGHLNSAVSPIGMLEGYNNLLSDMFKDETNLKCEDEDKNEEWD